jgi:Tfp pilus assembly protein PilF
VVNVEGYEEVRQTVGIGTGLFGSQTVNIPLREKTELIRTPADGGSEASSVIDVSELGRNHPRRAVQDYEKALEELRKGNTDKALELLTGVLKLAPDFYAAHNTLGTIYQKANRYREAETEYRRARELNARSADPLTNLGGLFIQEADARIKEGEDVTGKILDNALDTLEEAIKIKRSAMAYHLLGTAYYKSAFYEEAEANLKLALEFPTPVPTTRLMLANLYIRQKKWANALLHLDAYLAENPKAPERGQIQETRAKVVERVR